MNKLEVRGITKDFAAPGQAVLRALNQVSLQVGAGEFVSLIGPSGCGKSTLLDIIAGLYLPDTGDILLQGRTLLGTRGGVSYMPQKDVLFPWRTILDNVIVPLEVQGVSKADARREALALLPEFGLEGFARSYPYMLSGGMRQRAAFLRTVLCKKELLLLDEPFGKLDALTRLQMQHWLLTIWQKFKRAVLFVTHDVDEAILLSDRIYVMSPRPGSIEAEVPIYIKRPRGSRSSLSREFIQIKSHLLQLLEQGSSSSDVAATSG